MPDPHPHPLIETFTAERCSAILRTPFADAVEPAMRAAVDGGFRIIEFTLNTPNALEHIARFAAEDGLLVGAGTVLDVAEVDAAIDAGARFLVSPIADPTVIEHAVARGALMIPGCFTPAEMVAAHRSGAHIIKLFPGPAEGPDYLRACRGPLPFLRIFPTSGVTLDNVQAYLGAGAFGVGFVNCLFRPEELEQGEFGPIVGRAQRMVAAVRAATEGRRG